MEEKKAAFWLSRLEFKNSEPTRWIVTFEPPVQEPETVAWQFALESDQAAKLAAYLLGSMTSIKKAKASAANGKLGGRPRKDGTPAHKRLS